MPKVHLDRDPVTLQEGGHIAAQVGDKRLEPDTVKYITGDFDHITIYRSPNSSVQLNCTRDVEFLPGEEVILQQLGKHHEMGTNEQLLTDDTDPVSYAAIGMRSGKEVEFKE
jgi:hypothetical protein